MANLNRFLAIALAFVIGSSATCFAGPFGFERGMTPNQVKNLIGESAITNGQVDALGGLSLMVTTAPTPHNWVTQYTLVFSKKEGLLKIVATVEDIKTAGDGTELRERFKKFELGLVSKYGPPSDNVDGFRKTSKLQDPGDFMKALANNDAAIEDYWSFNPAKEGIENIALIAEAKGANNGSIELDYEFKGFSEYSLALKKAQDQVL